MIGLSLNKILIIPFALFVLSFVTVKAKDTTKVREMVFVSISGIYGGSSSSFFEDYDNYLGESSTFKHTPAFGGGLKVLLTKNFRIGASVDYFTSELQDSYQSEDETESGIFERNINSKIDISTLPILLNFEYLPIEQQFKTYLSAGAGITFSNFRWEEQVFSNRPNDFRDGGVQYDESHIFPTIRAATGIELDFDDLVVGEVIGNLTLELRYTYIFRNIDFYKEAKFEITDIPDDSDKSYYIIPGFLSLNLQIGLEYFHIIGEN